MSVIAVGWGNEPLMLATDLRILQKLGLALTLALSPRERGTRVQGF
jgi:hypothetical protein